MPTELVPRILVAELAAEVVAGAVEPSKRVGQNQNRFIESDKISVPSELDGELSDADAVVVMLPVAAVEQRSASGEHCKKLQMHTGGISRCVL